MNLSRCKKRTLIDIYYTYKFKKNLPFKDGTIPVPFIKQSECTDTPNSVDWYEWRDIVLAYIEKLKLAMEQGESIELGPKLGAFHLCKFKADRFIDLKKSKEQGKVVKMMRNNIENWFIAPEWIRGRVRLKMKTYWKIKLNRRWVRKIYLACEKDYTKIYKIRDSR